jgi:hypothetical protein
MNVNQPKPVPSPDPIQEAANGHPYLKRKSRKRNLPPGTPWSSTATVQSEAERADDDSFGEDRSIAVLGGIANAAQGTWFVVDAILQFSAGEQQDDITLVVARALQGNA